MGKPHIAVLPFSGDNNINLPQLEIVTSTFMAELIALDAFIILDRSKMDYILEEQGFQQSGACDNTKCTVEMGQLLGMEYMVSGKLVRFGKSYVLNIEYTDLGTARIINTINQRVVGDLDDVYENLCRKSAQELVQFVDPSRKVGSAGSGSSTGSKAGSFTDSRDGNVYKTVKIGTQVWMAENLRYLPSLNGTDTSSTESKYYVYGYTGTDVSAAKTTANYSNYGALYNWPAALKACPAGWHLPTDAEWTTLENFVGGSSPAGKMLKSTSGWKDNGNGTNQYGFNALSGGYFYSGGFDGETSFGYWWSATEHDASNAYYLLLFYDYDSTYRHGYPKDFGYSVRCVMN